MSDTARDYKTVEPAATEGLEDLFVAVSTPAQHSPNHSPVITSPAQAAPDHQRNALTIDQAANLLCVSPRTILRRLQKRSLPGFKVAGQFGPEWRVMVSEPITTPTQHSADNAQASISQPLTTSVHPMSSPDHLSESELVIELRKQIDDLKNELEEKVSAAQREIQAASFRNGYLESQLETERQQVKFLIDSRHKRHAWSRFWLWFIGK